MTTKKALAKGNQGAEFNARGNGPSINIDQILATFSIAAASGSIHKDASFTEGLQFIDGVFQNFYEASKVKNNQVKGSIYCKSCKQNFKPKSSGSNIPSYESSDKPASDTVDNHKN